VADRRLPFVGLIEHTNFVAEPTAAALPLRRQLPGGRARAAEPRRRPTARPLHRGSHGGEPGVQRELDQGSAGSSASRTPSRS
jgi:hypothetical protein